MKLFRSFVLAIVAVWTIPAQPAAPCPDAERLQGVIETQRRTLNDWGGLIRYGSVNTEVAKPQPDEARVVFIGDDITEGWTQFFPGRRYFNRGISGQTSAQMLVRFRQDVISLKPKVVVIQAGANDLAGYAGPATVPMISENLMSMVELAKANGIHVVLASLTPVCDCTIPQTKKRPVGKIMGVNEWLQAYAAESGSVFLDYYSALVSGRALSKDYTTDGFLLNETGYAVMAPLAERAIAQAMGKK